MRWVGDDEEDVFVTPDLKSLAFDTRSASSGRYFKVRWDGARIAVAAFVWTCMCVFHAHAHKIRHCPIAKIMIVVYNVRMHSLCRKVLSV